MLTNVNIGMPACDTVNQNGVYVEGIQYTLNKFSSMRNVYMYLDIAHSGWLGWDGNRGKAIKGFKELVQGATPSGSLGIIRGFASNSANYKLHTAERAVFRRYRRQGQHRWHHAVL